MDYTNIIIYPEKVWSVSGCLRDDSQPLLIAFSANKFVYLKREFGAIWLEVYEDDKELYAEAVFCEDDAESVAKKMYDEYILKYVKEGLTVPLYN